MSDIANLTPEESFKAGLPVVAQLEAWIAAAERMRDGAPPDSLPRVNAYLAGAVDALKKALALVTAKDKEAS